MRVLCGRLEEKVNETCQVLLRAEDAQCGASITHFNRFRESVQDQYQMTIHDVVRMAGCSRAPVE